MVPEPSEPVHVPIERLTLSALFDEVAERLASRLFVLFERRPEARALAFVALDLSSASNLLDVVADAHPALAQVRKLVTRAAEQLQSTKEGAR